MPPSGHHQAIVFCPFGHANPSTYMFCRECGALINTEAPPSGPQQSTNSLARQPSRMSASKWGLVAAAFVATTALVAAIAYLLVRDTDTLPTTQATQTWPTPGNLPQTGTQPPPQSPPAPQITFSTPSALIRAADSFGDTRCSDGAPLSRWPGYRAGRGSESTTCLFAIHVGEAYWTTAPTPSRIPRNVIAPGRVSCADVGIPSSQCSGDDFVMTCKMEGSDDWVTCRGGKDAVVYLF